MLPSARFATRISPRLSEPLPVNAIRDPSGDHLGPTPEYATSVSAPSTRAWMSHLTSHVLRSGPHWSYAIRSTGPWAAAGPLTAREMNTGITSVFATAVSEGVLIAPFPAAPANVQSLSRLRDTRADPWLGTALRMLRV